MYSVELALWGYLRFGGGGGGSGVGGFLEHLPIPYQQHLTTRGFGIWKREGL